MKPPCVVNCGVAHRCRAGEAYGHLVPRMRELQAAGRHRRGPECRGPRHPPRHALEQDPGQTRPRPRPAGLTWWECPEVTGR
jgi:hypothetical protein